MFHVCRFSVRACDAAHSAFLLRCSQPIQTKEATKLSRAMMMKAVLLCMCIGMLAVATNARRNEVKHVEHVPEFLHEGSVPSHVLYPKESLPLNWDWRNVGGTNYCTRDLNQHIPKYCGSCWAHGAMSSLSDRIKIIRRAQYPDFDYSIEAILACASDAGTCDGGDAGALYEWAHHNKVPEATCALYDAADHKCDALNMCRNCDPNGTCFPVKNYPHVQVDEYGIVSGEHAMMAEIYRRGPIACEVDADPLENYTGGILHAPDSAKDINHIISVAGWGVTDDNVKYWIVRNSWGTYYGEHGWFKVVRGINNIAIETACNWATPKMPLDSDPSAAFTLPLSHHVDPSLQ